MKKKKEERCAEHKVHSLPISIGCSTDGTNFSRMQCNDLIQLGTDHKTPLQTLVQIELFLMKLKPYFDLPLEKQIWRDSYILNNLRAFQSQEISCWLEELDGNVKHADPCWFSELCVAQQHVRVAIFITTIKAFLRPTGKKTNPFASKACFYQTKEEFSGTISNIGRMTWRYTFWCCQETTVTVSADKPVPCTVHSSYKPGVCFTGVSYVLLSRDVIFAYSLLDGTKYLWPQRKWCAGEGWYAGAAVSHQTMDGFTLCVYR